MRIVEIETYGRGGLTHYAYNLAGALAARGHDVTFVTTAAYELDDAPPTGAGRVRVVKAMGRWSARAPRWLPGFARALLLKLEAIVDGFRLVAEVRRARPDVVHLHCTHAIALLYLWLLRGRGKLVATAHVVTPHERIRCQQAVYSRIHALGDLVIAHSAFDRQRLLDEFGVEPTRVAIIPHGDYGFFAAGDTPLPDRATARAALGLDAGDEVALFFGYIREYKGLDVLLDAWPRVAATRPRARLVVAGDPVRLAPARRRELEATAERLGVVHRFGYVPFADVTRYVQAADTLVMPYRRISQSGVLFLALSLGLPVVATAVGGLPEMLEDGVSARLVPAEAPADLAAALVDVLGDEGLRTRLAAGGRAVSAACSWGVIAERTEQEFARLVDGRPSSPGA